VSDGPTIWVDADATPRPVKDILYRAAERVGVELVLVANQPLRVPRSKWIRTVQVRKGFDIADEAIADEVSQGDLVISADVPLAAAVAEQGATCLDPRGEVIDAANARVRLAARDRNEQLREAGLFTGGPKPYGDREKRQFAGALDRWLAKNT